MLADEYKRCDNGILLFPRSCKENCRFKLADRFLGLFDSLEMGLLKERTVVLAGCTESNSKNNRCMLLQIVNRCLSIKITALPIVFRLRAFYDHRRKKSVLTNLV